MAWIPSTFDVDLAAADYADVAVRVVINPTGSMVREYFDVTAEVYKAVGNPEKQEAFLGRYYTVLSKLLVCVVRGAEVIPLNTPEAVKDFEDNDDSLIAALALQALWEERTRRRDAAVKSFREGSGRSVVQANEPSAATG